MDRDSPDTETDPFARDVVTLQQKRGFVLSKYTIYETKERMYIVGSNKRETMFRILEIDLTVPMEELSLLEDNVFFTRNEIMDVLARLEDASGNQLTKILTCYALLGFIRFTGCYYMIVVTELSQVAVLGGHSIFHIDATQLVPIISKHNYKLPEKSSAEAKLMNIFKDLDLTKTFYFSFTYDITNTLQTNILREKLKAVNRTDIEIPVDNNNYSQMFMWNSNLLKPVLSCINSVYDWFQPIIHGFIDQVNVSVSGKSIYITLIARRSRFFAGARFLKRGVNTNGYVANEVETEQIVSDMVLTGFHKPNGGYFDSDRYTSFVQHRGSIPLYWTQEASNLTAKPPIEITVRDPFFSAAAIHFDNLFQRYGGGQIDVLNLIKTKEKIPREIKLLKEYEECINYLNQLLPNPKKIDYTSWDMSRASKQDGQGVLEFLETYAIRTIATTGIFHNNKTFETSRIQEGICRTNCIDCLDRTNAAQFVIGKRALGVQLRTLGIIDDAYLEYDSDIVNILTELFHDLGDTIALQYGGSHLVNTMETYRKINQWKSHSRDMIESIKRFYSNSFMDAQRQDAINLFLGNYVWKEDQPSLWEMNTDHYLHNDFGIEEIKRSYTHWWNIHHISSLSERINSEIVRQGDDITLSKIVENIRGYPDAFDNYWNEYYTTRAITWFNDLFAFNMNSTRRYRQKKGDQKNETSPFKSRKQSWINNQLRKTTQLKLIETLNGTLPVLNETDSLKKLTATDELYLGNFHLTKISAINKDLANHLDETRLLTNDDTILIEQNSALRHTDENKSDIVSLFNYKLDEKTPEVETPEKTTAFDITASIGFYKEISIDFNYYASLNDTQNFTAKTDYTQYFDFDNIKLFRDQ